MEVGKSWTAGQAEEGRMTPLAPLVEPKQDMPGESARARLTPFPVRGAGLCSPRAAPCSGAVRVGAGQPCHASDTRTG